MMEEEKKMLLPKSVAGESRCIGKEFKTTKKSLRDKTGNFPDPILTEGTRKERLLYRGKKIKYPP